MNEQNSPSVADMLREATSLVCAVAFYGPPVLFFAAPWLLLGLMLMGPFALVVTLVVALFAAAALIAGIGALLATPILMIRSRRTAHVPAPSTARAHRGRAAPTREGATSTRLAHRSRLSLSSPGCGPPAQVVEGCPR
jgi:hypothetical protein